MEDDFTDECINDFNILTFDLVHESGFEPDYENLIKVEVNIEDLKSYTDYVSEVLSVQLSDDLSDKCDDGFNIRGLYQRS